VRIIATAAAVVFLGREKGKTEEKKQELRRV
jgi:hypothetical protein